MPEHAISLFENFFPEDFFNAIDLDSIERAPDKIVASVTREYSCDLVFQFRFKADGPNGKFHYILVEFKTKLEKGVLFQVMKYHMAILEVIETLQKRPLTELPYVVKLLVHTGAEHDTLYSIASLHDPVPGWEKALLQEPTYIFVRLKDTPLEQLRRSFPKHIILVLLKLDIMGPEPQPIIETFDEYLSKAYRGQVTENYAKLLIDYIDLLKRHKTNAPCIKKIIDYFNFYELKNRRTPMTQEAIEILRVGIPDACLALGREEGREEGLQEGRQEGRQEVLQETLRDLLAERFRVIPETLAEKLLRIQESDLLKRWVVHFHKYKKLKSFEQDVDAALGQQAMA
jgi:hypothetical protein